MASLVSPRTLNFTTVFVSAIFLCLSSISAHGGAGHDDDHEHHGGGEDLRSTSLILVKVYCLIIMFFSTFVAGVSPYFFRWNESFLVLGTQFSGGVFFATSMIHFLADANETFKSLTDEEYPFAFMLASVGYLLTMLADCGIAYVARGSPREGKVDVEEDGKSHGDKEVDMSHVNPILLRTTTFGDTFMLILALCFHSVFEGIAIGVADTKGDAWRNLWTISLHKIFAAIAMGIALLKLLPKRPLVLTAVYSFAFAISSPVGVGIGIAINATTQGRVADWIYAISMSIACGVFIYVAINHLIAKGYKPQVRCHYDTPLFKFVAVLLGVAVIAVVMIWD